MAVKIPAAAISHPAGDVLYVIPNAVCRWRCETFFTKEPDTVAWISEFNPGDVFYDVGANVGMYSIWAAKTTGARVFAFEPESQNFSALCQNIVLNNLDVTAYPIALSNCNAMATLCVSRVEVGGSFHSLELAPCGFVQGVVARRLDDLELLPPDYIKIDVDGLEHLVIDGGKDTIRHCRSVLVEIDTRKEEHLRTQGLIQDWGFYVDPQQVQAARRTEGRHAGVGNIIFRR